MSGPVARYWAELGFRVKHSEIRKVDQHLQHIENKLKRFSKGLGRHLNLNMRLDKFLIDDRKLRFALGNALDKASATVVFDINRFNVNERSLRAALLSASRSVGPLPVTVRPNGSVSPKVDRGSIAPAVGGGVAGGIAGGAGRNLMHSLYAPMFFGGLGMYGLGAVNKMNQEVISARLTTQAVTEAAGLQDQGEPAFEWLRSQGNRVGFSYMDSAQDYNSFLANALGSGLGMEQSQETFLGFAEHARAMGITPARQKLVLNAASQMFGKGTVQSEELRRQMAESMPGTMPAFAEALQRMRGTNYDQAGKMEALYATLAPGKNINTAELAPFLAEVLRERAAPKLDIAMKTSQAEQARFKNQIADSAMVASNAGLEQGFSNIFKTMTTTLKELNPLLKALAGTFEDLTKVFQAPMYLLGRMGQLLGDLSTVTGIAEKNFINLALAGGLMMTKWGRVGAIFTGIMIVLEDIAMGVSGEGDSFTGRFIAWLEEGGILLGPFEKALLGVSAAMFAIAAGMKAISLASSLPGVGDALGKGGKTGKGGGGMGKLGKGLMGAAAIGGLVALPILATEAGYENPLSPTSSQSADIYSKLFVGFGGVKDKIFGPSPETMRSMYQRPDVMSGPPTLPGINTPINNGRSGEINVTVDVNIEAATVEDFNEQFKTRFTQVLTETLYQYPTEE